MLIEGTVMGGFAVCVFSTLEHILELYAYSSKAAAACTNSCRWTESKSGHDRFRRFSCNLQLIPVDFYVESAVFLLMDHTGTCDEIAVAVIT